MHFSFYEILDMLGLFSFAAAGALSAMEKKFDPFGVLIIAFVSSVGGGTIRDLLTGQTPVAWLKDLTAAEVIAGSTVLVLIYGARLKKWQPLLLLLDAMGLGLFTVTGIQEGLECQLSAASCIALGTVTACFGGVIRDVLLNKVPLIFQKEIYASASIAGGLFYFLLLKLHCDTAMVNISSLLFIFIVRLLAIRFKWSLPVWYRA